MGHQGMPDDPIRGVFVPSRHQEPKKRLGANADTFAFDPRRRRTRERLKAAANAACDRQDLRQNCLNRGLAEKMRRIVLRQFQRRISSGRKQFGVCSRHSLNTNSLRARIASNELQKKQTKAKKSRELWATELQAQIVSG
jgi:hypothetical protein